MTRAAKWIVAGAVAAAVLLAAALWIWQSARPATAEATALSYLRALESGDVAAIADLSPAVPDDSLTALDGADQRIADVAVTSVDESGDRATAAISFGLADASQTATLSLSRSDTRWVVDASSLGTASTTTTIGSFVAVGGVTFPTDEAISLLPAMYTASAAPADLLDGAATIEVLPGEASDVALEPTLRSAATTAAQEALDEHLAECTRPSARPPDGCGIRIPWGTEFTVVSDVEYRIDTAPTMTLDAEEFTTSAGVLVATVMGTGRDGSSRTTTYRTDAWMLRGDVAFTDTNIALTFW
ncbi:MAG: hypothetical protein P0Y60_07530 [Candidatus Microbacterium colombiense]|nr:MAG: hypothetical protein P0Y60_07530 [Microbacterium sp.]